MRLQSLSREGVLAGKNERVTDVHCVSSKWFIGVDLNDVQTIEVPNVNPFRVGDESAISKRCAGRLQVEGAWNWHSNNGVAMG
jgi:hypothetical protein